jgi:hypothetical protein
MGGIQYNTDPGSGQVLEYSATGSFLGNFTGSALQKPNQQPINTLFLPNGNVVTSTFGADSGFLVGSQGNEDGSLMLFNSSGQLLQNLGASAFPPNSSGVTGVALAYLTLDTTEPAPQSTVTSVVPNTGPTTGGNVVTINGTFAGSGDTVLFGTTAATVTSETTTSITVIAPAGAAGTVDVTVDGSAANAADQYTYIASSSGSGSPAPPSGNAPPSFFQAAILLFIDGAEILFDELAAYANPNLAWVNANIAANLTYAGPYADWFVLAGEAAMAEQLSAAQ